MARVILGISLHSNAVHNKQAASLIARELSGAARGSTIAIPEGPAFTKIVAVASGHGFTVKRFKFSRVKKLEAWENAVDLLHEARESTYG